jgi:hypothetical protein
MYFLEFWKEKESSKSSAIFILKVVKNILVRGSILDPKKASDDELVQEKTNI